MINARVAGSGEEAWDANKFEETNRRDAHDVLQAPSVHQIEFQLSEGGLNFRCNPSTLHDSIVREAIRQMLDVTAFPFPANTISLARVRQRRIIRANCKVPMASWNTMAA